MEGSRTRWSTIPEVRRLYLGEDFRALAGFPITGRCLSSGPSFGSARAAVARECPQLTLAFRRSIHGARNQISKNWTNFSGTTVALIQRLEIRQGHALVMTPQLMQAIKLLQLSQSRPGGLRRGGTRAQSAARANRRGRSPSGATMRGPGCRRNMAMASGHSADPGLDRVHRARRGSNTRTSRPPIPMPSPRAPMRTVGPNYSEWAGASTGAARSEDSDYNLEAFVAAETTLSDHLAEQLALAVTDPARRMIGQYLIDLVDEAGYLSGDLAQVGEKLGAPLCRSRGGARDPAGLRSGRRVRPQPDRVPGDSVARAQPLRSRDAGAGRASRSAGAARPGGACARCAGLTTKTSTDMIAEIRQLNPKPGLAFGIDDGAADRARRVRAARLRTAAGWSSSIPTRCRRCWSTRPTTREVAKAAKSDKDKSLSGRLPADRDLADPRARSARQDHSQGVDRNRPPAGRVLRPRRPAPAAAQPQDHRGRDQHARVDGVARHRQQVHGNEPRHLRTEVFLHLGDRGGGRRRSAFGRSGAPSHPATDRLRERRTRCCPTT